MQLAIVSPFPPAISGVGQYGYHITRALAQSGHFRRITVLGGSQAQGTRPNHLGNTEIEYCWLPGRLDSRRIILSRVQRLDPDLVWFNLGASVFGKSPWANISGLLTPMSVQRMGYPTVVTLHEVPELADLRALRAPGGPLASAGARLLTKIATRADVVCLTMGRYAEWLTAQHLDCFRIPIGAYYQPELLEEPETEALLFFTTLAPFKGLELLLEAFCRLRHDHPHLRLTIAGTNHARFPDYALALKARCSQMEGVRWLGEVKEDGVEDLFRRARIVVLPYTASTGSSSVLYQAATWGRAIVGSDLSDMRTLARESGLQIEYSESGNVESLQNAIHDLLASPARRRSQVENNFRAIQGMRPETTCQRYLQAFNRALEKRNSPQRIPLSLAPSLERI